MTWGWKVPSPLPSSTDTVPSCSEFATARSSWPSPLKSPATMADGIRPHRVGDRGLERAVAVAQQHRHVVAVAGVGDGQVEVAVAVEVARHDGVWDRPHRVGDLGLEGAVAVAQQHRDGAVES